MVPFLQDGNPFDGHTSEIATEARIFEIQCIVHWVSDVFVYIPIINTAMFDTKGVAILDLNFEESMSKYKRTLNLSKWNNCFYTFLDVSKRR